MREPVGLNRLKTSWEKGPEAHLNLWRRLRAGGRQVRVVAVAWEPSLLTRAGRVLSTRVGKDSQDENAPDTLRKAIAEGDWETIEQHGGLNEVMSRIGKRAEGGRIDGFTLWWPERCRQIGAHPTKGTWCAEVVRGPEPFSRRRHPPPPVAGLPPKMPESAPVKGSGEPLQPPPAERYGPAGHSPVRQVTRRTGHHGGSAPPPVRLRGSLPPINPCGKAIQPPIRGLPRRAPTTKRGFTYLDLIGSQRGLALEDGNSAARSRRRVTAPPCDR